MTRSDLDRRQALRALGVVGAAGAFAVPALLAGEASSQPPAKPEPVPEPAAAAAADPPKEPSAEAQRLGEIARARYGSHLDEAQWKELVADIDGNLQSAAELRKAALRNADEPDTIFRVEG